MKLQELTAAYIDYKHSLGMRFSTDASTLNAFCRAVGNVDLDQIDDQAVNAFLVGTGPITAYWHQKYAVLKSFYRFAIERGHTDHAPGDQRYRSGAGPRGTRTHQGLCRHRARDSQLG